MAYAMEVDWELALEEARAERDAALATAQREAHLASEQAARRYEAMRLLEQKNAALEEKLSKSQERLATTMLEADRAQAVAKETMLKTLKSCQADLANANGAKEAAENALQLMSQAYLNLNAAFHELAEDNVALRHELFLAGIRNNNREADKTEMLAELQDSRAALDAMSQDFTAARAFIVNQLHLFTESAIVAVALLEQERRGMRS
jgi:hypothetical protein